MHDEICIEYSQLGHFNLWQNEIIVLQVDICMLLVVETTQDGFSRLVNTMIRQKTHGRQYLPCSTLELVLDFV